MPMLSSLCPKLNPPHFLQKPTSRFGSTPPPNSFVKNSQQPSSQVMRGWSVVHLNKVLLLIIKHCIILKIFWVLFFFFKLLLVLISDDQSVAAIVFGDGSSNSRLYPLTKRRSEAAIPIAGNYRLIDSVLSNCINSNITKIYALTQFNSTSLNSHISRAYSGPRLSKDGFVEVIAAYQSPEDNGWFQVYHKIIFFFLKKFFLFIKCFCYVIKGSADAIRRCLWVLEEYSVDEFLILPGHHLYKMDYQKIVESHRRREADITVTLFSGGKNEDFGFGIFKLNAENQVLEFRDNPTIVRAFFITHTYFLKKIETLVQIKMP